ncbi:bifunctional metallophosphatase/5'-nucleotidase [Mycoplasmatota bacterium]|nr:bifunctional metallophosphatase/5'-nucleotidase [Mycoplasmatota bacterium]
MKFKILHTNDIHSNYENFAKIKTLINLNKDENTIILDAGDFADFKRVELMGTKGKLAGQLLEKAGYDAITIGNNETFQGIKMLESMTNLSPIPFLSCNLLKSGKPLNDVNPFIFLIKQNVRFLIIGTSPNIPIFNELMGFSFIDYREEITKIIQENKHDVCILVNHIGTKNDELLANSIDGIDIIISSHDHKLYPEAKIINGVINHSAGQYGENLGVIEFELQDNKLSLSNSKVISTNTIQKDTGIIKILAENKIEAINYLSQALYPLNQTLYHDYLEECPIGNLLADSLRDLLKCDIGLINSGIINGGIKKGFVTDLKLIEIAPSPLNATSFEVKGKDIKAALQISLDPQNCLHNGKGPGFRGIALGRLHVSGMTIIYKNQTINKILIGNEELNEEKYYTVGSSDYLQRNQVYTPLNNNINPNYHVEYIRDVLKIYLPKQEFVDNAFINRWISEN